MIYLQGDDGPTVTLYVNKDGVIEVERFGTSPKRKRRSGSPTGYTRVGRALGKPHGPKGRQGEYGIYRSPSTSYGMPTEPHLYAQYEGYREGDTSTGLPLGGPGWREQSMIEFVPGHFAEVTFFKKSPKRKAR